jgi:protease-4
MWVRGRWLLQPLRSNRATCSSLSTGRAQSSPQEDGATAKAGRFWGGGWVSRLSRTLRNTLALIGLSTIALSALTAARADQAYRAAVGDRPASVILEIPLDRIVITEEEPIEDLAVWRRLWRRLSSGSMSPPEPVSLFQVTRALEDAARDPRIAGILTTSGSNQGRAFRAYTNPLGVLEEVTAALRSFALAGQPTAFYAPSFENTAMYYLAAAHEKIFMHPTGIWNVVGLSAGGLFLRDLLDAEGVRIDVIRCGEYKTAANSFTQTAYTPEHREAVQALLDTMYVTIVQAIVANRRKEPARVEALINTAPLSASEAFEANLVDALAYPDAVRSQMQALVLARMQERAAERQEARELLEQALLNPQALEDLSDSVERWLRTRPWEANPPSVQREPAAEWFAAYEAVQRARSTVANSDSKIPAENATVLVERIHALLKISTAQETRLGDAVSDASIDTKRPASRSEGHARRDSTESLRFCPVTDYIAERSLFRSRLERAQQSGLEWLKRRFSRTEPLGNADRRASIPVIAIVPVTGVLTDGSVRSPLRALRKASKDPKVCAVVLRVVSPGGTVTASENLRQAVEQCAQAKPVIASFGEVAASGAYLAALGAKHIIAPTCCITGSIGVILLRLNLLDVAKRNGIQFDHVSIGKNAPSFAAVSSLFQPLDEEQQQRLQSLVHWQYKLFCERVSRARRLSEEAVQRVARGRVWSGADALRNGVVDQQGGLQDAIRLARREAGLAAWDPASVDARYGQYSGSAVQTLRRLTSRDRDDTEQEQLAELVLRSPMITVPSEVQRYLGQCLQLLGHASVPEPMALWLEGIGFWIHS